MLGDLHFKLRKLFTEYKEVLAGIGVIFGIVIPLLTFLHTRHKDAADAAKSFQKEGAEAAQRRTYGACFLKPLTPANVKRLNKFIEEGEYYKTGASFDLAAHRFQQVIDIDPNYLGANQDLGVVEMAKGDLEKAQASFDAELKVIDCLRSIKTGDLGRFAYWLGSDRDPSSADAAARRELDKAEDAVHYNMACAFGKQKEQAAALDELRKAAEHHSIHRSTIAQDPDLRFLSHADGYQSVLAMFG